MKLLSSFLHVRNYLLQEENHQLHTTKMEATTALTKALHPLPSSRPQRQHRRLHRRTSTTTRAENGSSSPTAILLLPATLLRPPPSLRRWPSTIHGLAWFRPGRSSSGAQQHRDFLACVPHFLTRLFLMLLLGRHRLYTMTTRLSQQCSLP
jgi:hypothetical protein